MVGEGTYAARASTLLFAKSSKKETPVAAIVFIIEAEGPYKGSQVEYEGWLTENTKARTFESLGYCGYDGTDPKTISRNQVFIEVEHKDNTNNDGQVTGKRARVRWVNASDGARGGYAELDNAARASLESDVRGQFLAWRQQQPAKPAAPAASFPHGANAPSGQSPKY